MVKLIIVDDHPAVRFGLESILNKFSDLEVLGTAESGETALALCQVTQPEVALIDMFMPQMDGVETTRAFTAQFPNVRIIILTQSDQDENVLRALEAGALGYLIKDTDISVIAEAIRNAALGKRTMSPSALEAVIRAKTGPVPPPGTQLTERELQILELLANGLTNREIAELLVISLSTVKFHTSVIFRKLDVQTRTEAVVKGLETGLVKRSEE